jgi:serine/threonine protein kinase
LDIKPDNILISSKDHKVRVIDFGTMTEYTNDKDGKHKVISRNGFIGTPSFAPIKALEGFSLSRRDDLESLAYTIMYLYDPSKIPWIGISPGSQNYRQDVLRFK